MYVTYVDVCRFTSSVYGDPKACTLPWSLHIRLPHVVSASIVSSISHSGLRLVVQQQAEIFLYIV